jgi:putative flippase GtrA
MASGIFSFLLLRIFVFEVKGERHRVQALQYLILLLINILLTSAALALALTLIPYVIVAKFVSDVSCLTLSYLVSKHYIFVDNATHKNSQADI